MTLPVLIVEDDDDLREALCDTLMLGGYRVLCAEDGAAALAVLETQRAGLVLSDVQMQPMDGETLLRELKARYPWLPVVLMTAYGVIDRAVAALHAGACHYLPKPFESEQLLQTVAQYLLPDRVDDDVIAQDPAMRRLLDMARRVAQSDASVMITGESGVGKEVLARFIHRNSARASKPFVAINCAAIPEQLLESTLFGHEKGSFTGAGAQHVGKFEQAQGGTLLLDEVTEMPLLLQSKLLRVLQEREVERVGGVRPVPVDIRVLATSNRDVASEVEAGRFREDLYYRLNVFPLLLPALRERQDDILPLARAMLARHAATQKRRVPVITPSAELALLAHSWEGNVRELDNVIQRALILACGDEIDAEHLYLPAAPARIAALPPLAGELAETLDLKALEKQRVLDALRAANGVRRLAAEMLNMSERTLRYRLQQYREQDGELPI